MIFDPSIPLAENIRRFMIPRLVAYGFSPEEAEKIAVIRRSTRPGVDFQCAGLVPYGWEVAQAVHAFIWGNDDEGLQA